MSIGKQAKVLTDKQQNLTMAHLENTRYPLRNKIIFLLIATDNLKNFPEIVAQKLLLEVCDFISDISATATYKNKRSRDGMEKWAEVLKAIDGYSSPEVCVIALNEAMRIRSSISLPNVYSSCVNACDHFIRSKESVKEFVRISTDIIDTVFEQIHQQKNNHLLIDALKNAEYTRLKDKHSLQYLMRTGAVEAFLSGDENYKKLWDKQMVKEATKVKIIFFIIN